MSSPLKVLILEDRLADAGLMLSELSRAGFSPEWYVAGTESAYVELLNRNPDLILSNYSLQQTDALRALQILSDSGKRIPFIVVTDAIGDEAAVECIKRGAADFLLKDRIALLGNAVANALNLKVPPEEGYFPGGDRIPTRSYLKALPDLIYLVSESGEYLDLKSDANATSAEEDPRTVHAFLPADVAESFIDHVRSVLESGDAQSMEFRVELYGEPKDYEARFFSTGRDLALVIMRDLTERKLPEQTLEGSNRRVDDATGEFQGNQWETIQQQRLAAQEFLSSEIAHILNNALAPILGFAELALTRSNVLEDKERLRNYFQHIKSSAQRTAHVVSQLREFYLRSLAEEESEAINLNDLILEAMSLAKSRWVGDVESRVPTHDINTEFQDLAPVRGSEAELRRAVTALIENALDAMPEGGTLNLRTRQDDDKVILEVSDSGLGMSEKVRQRCFEPFFTTMGDKGASGMGMAVAYGVVQRHKGTIQVKSEEAKGTTITVSLPVFQPDTGNAEDEDEEHLNSRHQ